MAKSDESLTHRTAKNATSQRMERLFSLIVEGDSALRTLARRPLQLPRLPAEEPPGAGRQDEECERTELRQVRVVLGEAQHQAHDPDGDEEREPPPALTKRQRRVSESLHAEKSAGLGPGHAGEHATRSWSTLPLIDL